MVSLPFLSRQKAEFSVGVAGMEDQYFQTKVIDFTNAKRDASNYTIFGGSVALDGNTLNSRQYATSDAGTARRPFLYGYGALQGRYGRRSASGGYEYIQSWLQLSYEMERYFNFRIISRWVLISRDIILRGTSVIITGLP